MRENIEKQPILAGEAFLASIVDDSKLQKPLLRLRAFAESIKAVGATYGKVIEALNQIFVIPDGALDFTAELHGEWEKVCAKLSKEIKRSMRATKVELAMYGLPLPDDLQSWEDLARLVEKEPASKTIHEIYRWAIAWAKRELLRLRMARGQMPVQHANVPAGNSEIRSSEDASIRRDEYDPRLAWCAGKRIYLGEDTQISRLFWLLASPVGLARTLGDVQRAVDGFETERDRDSDRDGFKKASQRVRKAISRLRKAIYENGAVDHLTITRGGSNRDPDYTMLVRFPK